MNKDLLWLYAREALEAARAGGVDDLESVARDYAQGLRHLIRGVSAEELYQAICELEKEG